jgi:hypothetical protein
VSPADVLEPKFVELIPAEAQPGILYVSMTYATTAHLCPCGCGHSVVLPLSPAQWRLYYDGDAISLTPSVGNWDYACRSHYWIRHNTIIWARRWSALEVDRARKHDAADLNSYYSRRLAGDDHPG